MRLNTSSPGRESGSTLKYPWRKNWKRSSGLAAQPRLHLAAGQYGEGVGVQFVGESFALGHVIGIGLGEQVFV